MIIQIEVEPEFHRFCKDKEDFVSILKDTLEDEMYLRDLYGQIKSVKEVTN